MRTAYTIAITENETKRTLKRSYLAGDTVAFRFTADSVRLLERFLTAGGNPVSMDIPATLSFPPLPPGAHPTHWLHLWRCYCPDGANLRQATEPLCTVCAARRPEPEQPDDGD